MKKLPSIFSMLVLALCLGLALPAMAQNAGTGLDTVHTATDSGTIGTSSAAVDGSNTTNASSAPIPTDSSGTAPANTATDNGHHGRSGWGWIGLIGLLGLFGLGRKDSGVNRNTTNTNRPQS